MPHHTNFFPFLQFVTYIIFPHFWFLILYSLALYFTTASFCSWATVLDKRDHPEIQLLWQVLQAQVTHTTPSGLYTFRHNPPPFQLQLTVRSNFALVTSTIQKCETGKGLFKSNEKGTTVLPWETSLAWWSKKVTGPRSLPTSRPNTESLSPGSQQEISKCLTCELSFMQLISAHLLPSLCCSRVSRHRAVTERGPLAGSLITRDNTGARNCELVQPGLRWHLVPTMGWHKGFPPPRALIHADHGT